jgi:LysM repeat protein
MRTPLLVGIVVVAHCVAVGSVFLIQGCGTPTGDGLTVEEPLVPVYHESSLAESTAAPVAAPKSWPAQTTTYIVKPGDSISGIAKRAGLSVSDIVSLNSLVNPDRIRVGQKLVLPGDVKVRAASSRPAAAPVSVPRGGTEYVVRSGDCLSVIASRFGTSTAALKKINNLSSDFIRIGQRLAIPGGGKAAPAAGTVAPPDVDLDDAPALPQADANPVSSAPSNVHVVEEGEDIYSVAMSEAVSVAELKRLNDLSGDEVLKPGDRLLLPVRAD